MTISNLKNDLLIFVKMFALPKIARIFASSSPKTMKDASANNSSTLRVAHVTSRTKTPGGATSVPTISVYVTGTRNNPYLFAIRKAFF
jgi:hypothetical protein